MSKQRMKAPTRREPAAQLPSDWKTHWKQVQGWLPVALYAVFALALPFLTGTNDLLWTGIVLATLLALGIAAVVGNLWRKQMLPLTVAEICLLAFAGWQWLTVAPSVYRWASLLEAGRWTAFAVVALVVRRLYDERRGLWVAGASVAVVTVTALQGLADYALNAAMGNLAWRIFGPFLQPNLFANFLLMGFFVASGILWQRPQGWAVLPAFVAFLLFVAMVLTGSKGALLAWLIGMIALGAIAMAQSTAKRTRKRLWLALVLGLATLCATAVFVPPIRMRFETLWTAQAHSSLFRWLVWKATLTGATAKPLAGFGAGTFEWVYPQFTTVGFTRHAHNGFLQVAMESGFAGLALLLLFFAVLLFTHFACLPTHRTANLPNSNPPAYRLSDLPIRYGCIAAVIAFCSHNLVETAWMTLANLLTLAVVCGIVLAPPADLQAAELLNAHLLTCRTVRLPWKWQCVLLVPLLGGLWHTIAVARGAYFAGLARKEVLPSARLYWLERAGEVDPLNARHKIDRAVLLAAWSEATGDEGRLQQALQLCEEAIRLQPTRSGNYKVKARILQTMGKLDEAERALRTALRFNQTDTEALLRLGELLEWQNKTGMALQIYRRLVALEGSAYGRYKPVEQWQDIFIAAGKVRLAEHLLASGKRNEARLLLNSAAKAFLSFRDAYLPILKAGDPEAAHGQGEFVRRQLVEIQRLLRLCSSGAG